jgi:hypothetical protein
MVSVALVGGDGLFSWINLFPWHGRLLARMPELLLQCCGYEERRRRKEPLCWFVCKRHWRDSSFNVCGSKGTVILSLLQLPRVAERL